MKRVMIAAVTFISLSAPVWVAGPVARASIAFDEVGCCNEVCCWMDDSRLCLNPPPECKDGSDPYPIE
jgi:hypothetical protein